MKVVPPSAWPRRALAPADGGGPATIGQLLRAGQGLIATCEVCLHSGRLDLADLAEHLGDDHACSTDALRKRLQCSVCKSRAVVVQETGGDRGSGRAAASKIVVLAEV